MTTGTSCDYVWFDDSSTSLWVDDRTSTLAHIDASIDPASTEAHCYSIDPASTSYLEELRQEVDGLLDNF